MNAGYSFGISEFTTKPWSFERDLDEYSALGIDAIEVAEEKLDPGRAAERLRTARARLKISSLQPALREFHPTRSHPKPEDPGARLEAIKASLRDLAPYLPANTPFIVGSGTPPQGDVENAWATARAGLRALGAVARDLRMRIAFEPLAPTLMNVETAICSLADGLALVREVDHESVGLCVDTWNVAATPDLNTVIERAAEKIFIVQVSDARLPHAYDDRLVPGDGSLPLASMLRACRHSGYDGPYVVEIFSDASLADSLWRSDLREVVIRCARGFERVWNEALNE